MYPVEHKALPPPYKNQKDENIPGGRREMGLIPQPAHSQYRPTQGDTNPNVRKDNTIEKRKRAVPTKRFRPSAGPKPSETAMCPPATVSIAPVNVKCQTDTPENRP